MHYYQFNIGDYRAATAHLSNDEDLAYRRLLDMYYDSEQKIALDTQWVSRRLRLPPEVVRDVLNDMFILEDDGWFHPRCDEVIKQYHAMAEKNRANGKLGGRKKNPVGSDTQPTAKATINDKPITINDIPPKAPKGADVRFDKFWMAYPKKVGKFDAKRSFDKRKIDDELLELILKAVARQSGSDAWRKDGGQFIPNPSTWLNQGRWEDEGVSFVSTTSQPAGRDPALVKLDQDKQITKPPSLETLQKMALLRKGA